MSEPRENYPIGALGERRQPGAHMYSGLSWTGDLNSASVTAAEDWDQSSDWLQRPEPPDVRARPSRKAGATEGFTIQARQDLTVLHELQKRLAAQISPSDEHSSGDHRAQ
ncbi:hypothetical protein [Haloactinomyces albus]|uniref:Uncharacterized protein n=1 Tax=Haloactinomyces albus TaxID=1352928 RepID=A0AAE4CQ78_9ACTN|nr:hypothetical protein [Haloactinomyces albus]MDR7303867.1 hypothetical protein [Haloactinomyces albus]